MPSFDNFNGQQCAVTFSFRAELQAMGAGVAKLHAD